MFASGLMRNTSRLESEVHDQNRDGCGKDGVEMGAVTGMGRVHLKEGTNDGEFCQII